MTQRRVDDAMDAERPQKQAVRLLWVEEVRRYVDSPQDAPLYLTLPGRKGGDILELMNAGLINQTEVGGVAKEDQGKVVAVESSPMAVRDLQAKIPGLKIVQQPVQNLVRGELGIRWPSGGDEVFCRAYVVNLDLNEGLGAVVVDDGRIVFPALEMVRKFARLHLEPVRRAWTLLLTLHASTGWTDDVSLLIKAWLRENCEREPTFGENLAGLLGQDFVETLGRDDDPLGLGEMTIEEQQRFLCALVPKKVAELVRDQLWSIRTVWNIRYGGREGEAPMVSWVLGFGVQERQETEEAAYRRNLRGICERIVRIDDEGNIHD